VPNSHEDCDAATSVPLQPLCRLQERQGPDLHLLNAMLNQYDNEDFDLGIKQFMIEQVSGPCCCLHGCDCDMTSRDGTSVAACAAVHCQQQRSNNSMQACLYFVYLAWLRCCRGRLLLMWQQQFGRAGPPAFNTILCL